MGMKQVQIADKSIIIHEPDDLCDSTTGRVLTGAWVWNSALILAEWMVTHCRSKLSDSDFEFRDKSVIELGAGAGLPGITAALLGASRVVLTDIEQLLPGLLKNVKANGLEDRVEVRELIWGSDKGVSQTQELGEFDLILMSDVFLDPDEIPYLALILKSIIHKKTRIWAASEVRPWTGEHLKELTNQGFKIHKLNIQLDQSLKEDNEIVESFAIFHLELRDEESGV